MSEPILKALMQLFALILDIHEEKYVSESEKGVVRLFLSRQLNADLVEKYMEIFNKSLNEYHKEKLKRDSIQDRKHTSLTSIRILGLCEAINEELEQKQKIYLIIQLIEFISFSEWITEKEHTFLHSVASAFHIPESVYENISHFIIGRIPDIPDKTCVLIIDNKEEGQYGEIKHIYNKNLNGKIYFLNIDCSKFYILRYNGRDDLYLNGQHLYPGLTHTFDRGSSIRNSVIESVYYSDVAGKFTEAEPGSKISITAEKVTFRYRKSKNGILDFNLHEESGKLVGIIGSSGVGKSTLLNILNGNLKPHKGKVLINGYNLYDKKESKELEGVIGFVPQDDLLIEELTVYQNLCYNARLCLAGFPENKIKELAENVLVDLDLYEIRDLKVGTPTGKIISGGQRKRLNIALELIREPSILFIDEPTSGLSSVDSEVVMNLLKEQTYHGKLVIANIHQPSSELYKMFDRIIFLDRGGYQVYYGDPMEAVVYFKKMSHHANANEDHCIRCGNVNPEQILQIIEAKIVNEHGKLTRTRKVSAREWHERFKKYTGPEHDAKQSRENLPENYYSIPNRLKQMRLFMTRDLLSKITNKQYLLISLLEAPVLAVILGFFTKQIEGLEDFPGKYVFENNENLPAYLFISVVVSLFLGLIISSEEIIKDRKILQRESFLHLSRSSYLNSKIVIMFMLSAIQTISYVLIGNLILEIKGMTLSYCLILFTTSCFANMMGLNISSGFNSVITIYITIPFLLIPQLLFGGVIVKFDKLHESLTSYEYVPVIGDLMASRWAYEALAVEQFKNNRYQRNIFLIDQERSNSDYYYSYLLPQLQIKATEVSVNMAALKEAGQNPADQALKEQTLRDLNLLRNHIQQLNSTIPSIQFGGLDKLNYESFNDDTARKIEIYLGELSDFFRENKSRAMIRTDNKKKELAEKLGGYDALRQLIRDHNNSSLENLVLNRKKIERIVEEDGQLIRKYRPVYMIPTSSTGRAHFYAPVKKIGNRSIDTFWFNLVVIWIYSGLLYLILYFDLIRRVVSTIENIRLRKTVPD